MDVPVVIISAVLAIFIAVGGWAFRFLLSQVQIVLTCQSKCQENQHNRRASDFVSTTDKMDLIKTQISNISVWQGRFEEMMEQNKREHNEIIKMMERLDFSMKELEKCVTLLMAGKEEC